jgi:hypothetical protein
LIEFFEDGRLELYNLQDDIGERNNLAKSQPEKTAKLHQKLISWRKETGVKMPTPQSPEKVPGTTKTKKSKRKQANTDD